MNAKKLLAIGNSFSQDATHYPSSDRRGRIRWT